MINCKLMMTVVVAASVMAVGQSRTVVVGGSQNWRYGFNYTDWAINNSPFYISDKLVFKYHNPSYNVYLLPDLWSYLTCDFSRGRLLAGPTSGGGPGFVFEITQWRPHYFAAAGERNCKAGKMKLFIVPFPHWNF